MRSEEEWVLEEWAVQAWGGQRETRRAVRDDRSGRTVLSTE